MEVVGVATKVFHVPLSQLNTLISLTVKEAYLFSLAKDCGLPNDF